MTSQLLSNSGSTTTPLILYWSSLQNTSFTYDEEYEWWLNNDTMRGITVAGDIWCQKSTVAKLDTPIIYLLEAKLKRVKQLISSPLCTSTFSSRCSFRRHDMVQLRHHELASFCTSTWVSFFGSPINVLLFRCQKYCWPQAAVNHLSLIITANSTAGRLHPSEQQLRLQRPPRGFLPFSRCWMLLRRHLPPIHQSHLPRCHTLAPHQPSGKEKRQLTSRAEVLFSR